jgi:lysophospholipase L1-like esterase
MPDLGTSEPPSSEPAPSEPTPADPEPEPEPEPSGPLTLYLAGDSIVQTYADTASDSDQAGWGQMLGGFFDAEVTVNNRAIGGRTARRFIDEGRLDAIVAELEPGDYLLVQFGTNDGNRTATYTIDGVVIPYFLEPSTDFRAYLQRYIDAARSRSANPVLVTPTPRNSAYCTGGNGTGAHAAAMTALGQEQGVPVVDLNARTVGYLREICPAPTPEDFFLLRGDGTVDGTHFQENGARILASFVADGLSDIGTPFAAHRRP